MTKPNTNYSLDGGGRTPWGHGGPGNGKPPWTAAEKRELALAQLLNSEKPLHSTPDAACSRLRLEVA